MHFSNTLAIFVAASMVNANAAASEYTADIAARSDFGADLEARGEGSFDERDYTSMLYERAVLEARKPKLLIPKDLDEGSIPQNQREEAQQLGLAALKTFGKLGGTVVYGWHTEGSLDPVDHFTIKPDDRTALIHVHKTTPPTQGYPKQTNQGTSKKPGKAKRDLDAVAHLLDERELDMLEFHRSNALHARAIYHEAYDRSVANALL